MRAFSLVVAIAVCSACSGGGSPISPSPGPVPPSATLVAVPGFELQFPDWPCASGACRYRFAFRNNGPDCARGIGGTFRLLQADGVTVLAADAWGLEDARVVRPGEQVEVEDGTLPKEAVVAVGAEGRYSLVFEYTPTSCS